MVYRFASTNVPLMKRNKKGGSKDNFVIRHEIHVDIDKSQKFTSDQLNYIFQRKLKSVLQPPQKMD